MKRVIVAGFKQETATFNPVLTRYGDFHQVRAEDLVATLGGTRVELAGAMAALVGAGVEILPCGAAWCESGGPVAQEDLDRLTTEILDTIRARADGADGAYISLHGAMAGTVEMDPEGRLLEQLRGLLGDRPVVASLDLHAVLTERMVRCADLLVPFHTYPHVDHYETGVRAAGLLRRLLEGGCRPAAVQVPLPMLVRGDELITATGRFGQAMARCRQIEQSAGGLAAGVLIGNPFTDVPELRSNVLVIRDGDGDRARAEATEIAAFMWDNRQAFKAELTSLEEAIDLAEATDGLTVFSDAADATSSGAPGDSNAILRGLLECGYGGRSLLTLVDAAAAQAAHEAGPGADLALPLGGSLDPDRHTPLKLRVRVKALADGGFTYSDGTAARGGPTAVLQVEKATVVVTSRPVHVMDRQVFEAHGQKPVDFDLVVVKSPNGFRPHYESIAARILPVDVPGATSANLRTLPYRRCVRPLFPLDRDEEVEFPVACEQ